MEVLGPSSHVRRRSPPKSWAVEVPADCGHEAVDRAWLEECVFGEEFGVSTNRGCNAGSPARHGFDKRPWHTFGVRTQDEEISPSDEIEDCVVIDHAFKGHHSCQAQGRRKLAVLLKKPTASNHPKFKGLIAWL
jgi:hypothetical protein